MNPPIDNNEPFSDETKPNKRRRKKSIVWEHFTVETVGAGCTRAYCNQCKKSFAYITGSKLAGTSHLKRHIALGICPVSRQKNQLSPYTPGSKPGNATEPPKRRYRANPGPASLPFDQERCSHEIVKMIIQHEYPLHIVEHPGFIDFVRTLQPRFNMVSFNTIQGDCVAMYLREKENLLNCISRIPGRVSLTMDLWTSNQGLGYVLLTGHFVDANWLFQRRILNVVMVPSLDSDDALNQAVVACLSDWHLEGKLFTLTLDHLSSNDTAIGKLRGLLSVKNPLTLNGQLLIGNCYARVLSCLAQDALGAMWETIKKIRESVKYVKMSDTHEEKFVELKQRLQVPSIKDLSIDDQTRWDSTYHMLVAACELKEVFACLDAFDEDYKIAPSMNEWTQVETLCTYLKLLFDAAVVLVTPIYPTTNTFFHEVWKIQMELSHAAISQDPFISNLTKPLQEKFDKYWRDCSPVLAIAVIMDPRFKMKLVDYSFSKIYGEDAETWIRIVDDSVHELFLEYISQTLPMPPTFMEGNEGITKLEAPREGNEVLIKLETPQEGNGVLTKMEAPENGNVVFTKIEAPQEERNDIENNTETPQEVPLLSTINGFSDFEVYISEMSSSQEMKLELDQYLDESLLPRVNDFDVLSWWELNKLKYPVLSKMAADILSVPVSTVAPESVFDTGNKKMDSYRSSLHPVTLEALICAKDWLQHGPSEVVSNALVKMEF